MDKTAELLIITKDGKTFKLKRNIINIVQLFNDIVNDFDLEEAIKLEKIDSRQLEKVIEFCEIINYTNISIDKRFYIIAEIELKLFSDNLKSFYAKLTQKDIVDYLEISDYLQIPSLDDICLLKLSEVLRSEDKINQFLSRQIKFTINSERKQELREKYKSYCSTEMLSPKEVNDMLELFEKCEAA